MTRTFIWLSTAVRRPKAFNTFKVLILIYRVFKGLIGPVNERSFRGSRDWIPLFLQNIGYKKL